MIEIGMTITEAAAQLNGREYSSELPEGFEQVLKDNNLLVVFRYSDDMTEFRGIFSDEVENGLIYITQDGLATSDCEEGSECPYFQKLLKGVPSIETDFSDGFNIMTTLPNAKFQIFEDGELYGTGAVFYAHSFPKSL